MTPRLFASRHKRLRVGIGLTTAPLGRLTEWWGGLSVCASVRVQEPVPPNFRGHSELCTKPRQHLGSHPRGGATESRFSCNGGEHATGANQPSPCFDTVMIAQSEKQARNRSRRQPGGQFSPGVSGNPRGRPREPVGLAESLYAAIFVEIEPEYAIHARFSLAEWIAREAPNWTIALLKAMLLEPQQMSSQMRREVRRTVR